MLHTEFFFEEEKDHALLSHTHIKVHRILL